MRSVSCPNCGQFIGTSWSDFLFLSTRGRVSIFCIHCKRMFKTNLASGNVANFVAMFLTGMPIYVVFYAGIFALPRYAGAIAILTGIPAFYLVRALVMQKFFKLEMTA